MKQCDVTIKGIGQKEGDRLYRKYGTSEIFYYEDKRSGLLIRQVLPQDVELVKKARRIEIKKYLAYKVENGQKKYCPLSDIVKEEPDEQIKKIIEESNPDNNDKGDMSLLVFNLKTKEFIALLDAIPDDEFGKKIRLGITFSDNKPIQKRYETLLKEKIKAIFLEWKLAKELYEEVLEGTLHKSVPI